MIQLPQHPLPPKPRHMSPCNGCGLCCALELCPAGKMAFPGEKAPCPALQFAPDGSRTFCAFVAVEIEHKLEPMLQEALGIGLGCIVEDVS